MNDPLPNDSLQSPDNATKSRPDEPTPSGSRRKWLRRLALICLVLVPAFLLAAFGGYVYRIKASHHPRLALAPFSRGSLFVQNPILWLSGRCYGQPRLISALQKAAQRLAQRVPGAHLAYLDLSASFGGKLLLHLSHRHGYDVDILYIGRRQNGKPYPRTPSLFKIGYRLRYGENGKLADVSFDRNANLQLVLALLGQASAPVEKIFVEPFIEKWLITEATKQKLPPGLIKRLRTVLRYAGPNAAKHTDHMHVRFHLPRLR